VSVGVCVTSPEGIAIATDSRRTVQIGGREGSFSVESDEAQKLFMLENRIAVATYGEAMIGARTVESLMEDFKSPISSGAVAVAEAIGTWFAKQLSAATKPPRGDLVNSKAMRRPVRFVVAGFDEKIGHLYEVKVRAGDSQVQLLTPNTENFGIYPFGQRDGIDRLLTGIDRLAMEEARISVSPEEEDKLRLLSYELVEAETLEVAIATAQSLVEVQLLAQHISLRAYANRNLRVPGCGGQIRTIAVARERARWEREVIPARVPSEFLSPVGATPRPQQRSA